MTPEEQARLRREARELSRARCAASAGAHQPVTTAWLMEQGALVPGESAGDRFRRLRQYRDALSGVQTSTEEPACRGSGPEFVEIEF